jgi:hypothetical protein
MRWWMIVKIHANDYAKKTTYLRHLSFNSYDG